MKTRTKSVLTAALMAATVLSVPAAASASPAGFEASSASDVHNCLAAFPSSGHAYVEYRYNSCGGRSIRSKVVIEWGPDSSCRTLTLGQTYTHDWLVGDWDGLVAC